MKAMILAAGKGERLQPLTKVVPKPLFPVANIPLIRYNIELLKKYGIVDIIINVWHLGRQLEMELGDGSTLGVNIKYSREKELWGTGGGLKQVEPFFEGEEDFVLINSDILIDVDLEDVIHFHRRHKAAATMVLTRSADTKKFGAVEIDENANIRNIAGRLEDIRESPRISGVFTGVHILGQAVFQYIPPNIFSCINEYAYPKMILNGEKVVGYMMESGFWQDLGTPETYYQVNMKILNREISLAHIDPLLDFKLKPSQEKLGLVCLGENVELGNEIQIIPPVIIGNNSQIMDKAIVGPCAIVGNGVSIGKQCSLDHSIVFPGTKIGNKSRLNRIILQKDQKLQLEQAKKKK